MSIPSAWGTLGSCVIYTFNLIFSNFSVWVLLKKKKSPLVCCRSSFLFILWFAVLSLTISPLRVVIFISAQCNEIGNYLHIGIIRHQWALIIEMAQKLKRLSFFKLQFDVPVDREALDGAMNTIISILKIFWNGNIHKQEWRKKIVAKIKWIPL